MYPINISGPVGLIEKNSSNETKIKASEILLTYTKVSNGVIGINGENFEVTQLDSKNDIKKYMIFWYNSTP